MLHPGVAAFAVDLTLLEVDLVDPLVVVVRVDAAHVTGGAAGARDVGIAPGDPDVAVVAADATLEVAAVVELEALVGRRLTDAVLQ